MTTYVDGLPAPGRPLPWRSPGDVVEVPDFGAPVPYRPPGGWSRGPLAPATPRGRRPSRRVRGWVAAVADAIHAAGDAEALDQGLAVRRRGLTGRSYRDPRIDAWREVKLAALREAGDLG